MRSKCLDQKWMNTSSYSLCKIAALVHDCPRAQRICHAQCCQVVQENLQLFQYGLCVWIKICPPPDQQFPIIYPRWRTLSAAYESLGFLLNRHERPALARATHEEQRRWKMLIFPLPRPNMHAYFVRGIRFPKSERARSTAAEEEWLILRETNLPSTTLISYQCLWNFPVIYIAEHFPDPE